MHEILRSFEGEIHQLLAQSSNEHCASQIEELKSLVEQINSLPVSALQMAQICGRVDRLITPILGTLETRRRRRITVVANTIRNQMRSEICRHQRESKSWEYMKWKLPADTNEEFIQRSINILQKFILTYLGRDQFPKKESDAWYADREELLGILRGNAQKRMGEIGVSNSYAHNGAFETYLEALEASVGDAYDLRETIEQKKRELKYTWDTKEPGEKQERALVNIQSAFLEAGLISAVPFPVKRTAEWIRDREKLLEAFAGDIEKKFKELCIGGAYTGTANPAFRTPTLALIACVGEHYEISNTFLERTRTLKYKWICEDVDETRVQTILTIQQGLLENGFISSLPLPSRETADWTKDRENLIQLLDNANGYRKIYQNTALSKNPVFSNYLDVLKASIGDHYDLNDVIVKKRKPKKS